MIASIWDNKITSALGVAALVLIKGHSEREEMVRGEPKNAKSGVLAAQERVPLTIHWLLYLRC